MKFYDWSIGPNPRRVRMFLAEKGIEIPTEEAGYPDKPFLRPEFLDAHAHRRVPLLVLDDGTEIGEAMAICRYLEELHPDPPLFGRTPEERAEIDMWERLCEWEGMHALSEAFRNARRSFADRGLAGYRGTVRQIPELIERGQARALEFYGKLNGRLESREFIVGDWFSVADITALCTVDFGPLCDLAIPDDMPYLNRWHDAVAARPSAKS